MLYAATMGDEPAEAARALVFLSLHVFPIAAAVAVSGNPPNPPAARRDAPPYPKYCRSRSGVHDVGEQLSVSAYIHREIVAPALDASQHTWHHSDDDLTVLILNASPRTPRTPAWKGTLSQNQVRDIVACIKSLWGPRAIECQGPKHMARM